MRGQQFHNVWIYIASAPKRGEYSILILTRYICYLSLTHSWLRRTLEWLRSKANKSNKFVSFCVCFLDPLISMQNVTILAQGLLRHTSDVHSSLSHCVRDAKVLADHFQDKPQHNV